MDKLINKALQKNFRTLLKKHAAWRASSAQQHHVLFQQTSQKEFLKQLTSISLGSSSICQNCLSSRITGLYAQKYKAFSSVFRKQLKAVTALLLKSNLLQYPASTSQTHHNASSVSLFSAGENKSQRDDNKGDRDSSGRQDNDGRQQDEDPSDEEKKRMEMIRSFCNLVAGLILMWVIFTNLGMKQKDDEYFVKYISWSEFYHNILLKGEVKSIHLHYSSTEGQENLAVIDVHDGAVIKNTVTSRAVYVIKIPKGFNFEERIRQVEDELGIPLKDRIPIKYGYPNTWVMLFLQILVVVLMIFFIRQVLSYFTRGKDGNMTDMMDVFSGGIRQAKFTRVDIASKGAKAISFKDVAGLKEAKIEIMEFVDYLTNPQRFKDLGAKTPRGALLLGPPGCGKTLLARALATEAKVPFLAMAGSEFVEMIGGVGAARVRNLFKEARKKAPCIIYIDEIDAVGRSRGGSASAGGEDEHTLNQLLVEMDGIGTQEGVIMIAATNRADILDKALLRPGRFDRHIMIDLPTLVEREEIFTVYLNTLKLAQPAAAYAKPLSKLTPGMSGADIANICNEAAIHAARDSRSQIDRQDFEYAVERVIAGVEKKTHLLAPTEKKVVAYHESGHALVGWMLKHTDALLRISIVPRTNSALGFAQYLPSDQKLYTQEELFERMCMALGGRVAESLIFNHVSTGAHDDLKRVTKMAYDQIRSFGMNPRIGNLSFPSEEEQIGVKPYSQQLAKTMDEEARRLVAKAFFHTQSVLQENKDKLQKLANALLEREVLNYEDIEQLIGPPIHGKKNVIEPHGWEGIMPTPSDAGKAKR